MGQRTCKKSIEPIKIPKNLYKAQGTLSNSGRISAKTNKTDINRVILYPWWSLFSLIQFTRGRGVSTFPPKESNLSND